MALFYPFDGEWVVVSGTGPIYIYQPVFKYLMGIACGYKPDGVIAYGKIGVH